MFKGFNNGQSALIKAVQSSRLVFVKILLSSGTEPNYKNHFREIVLSCAAKVGLETVVDHLLTLTNIDLNSSNLHGHTVLIHIAVRGHTQIVTMLFLLGANTNTIDYKQKWVLHWAVTCDKGETIVLLCNFGAGVTLDCQDSNRFTPLHMAIQSKRLDRVISLVDEGYYIDFRASNGKTALHFSSQLDNFQTTKFFL